MLAIGMLAAAAGLILGLRFSVITFVLLTLSIAIIFAIGVWGGGSPLVIVLQMLATLASVQISYLFGCLLAAHLPREPRRPPAARNPSGGRGTLSDLGFDVVHANQHPRSEGQRTRCEIDGA